MINIFKKGTKTLTSDIDTWAVRWNRRYGEFSGNTREVAQFFTNKEEAEEFANSLKKAIQLLGHTSRELTWIQCEKITKTSL